MTGGHFVVVFAPCCVGVAEWLNALVLKTSEGESLPRVRISPPPPIVCIICASQLGYQAKHTQKHTFKLSLLKPIPARSRAYRCPYLTLPHSEVYLVGDLLTLLRKRPQTPPLKPQNDHTQTPPPGDPHLHRKGLLSALTYYSRRTMAYSGLLTPAASCPNNCVVAP